jgi:hypothetical protein
MLEKSVSELESFSLNCKTMRKDLEEVERILQNNLSVTDYTRINSILQKFDKAITFALNDQDFIY